MKYIDAYCKIVGVLGVLWLGYMLAQIPARVMAEQTAHEYQEVSE